MYLPSYHYGARRSRSNKRKGVDEYASENPEDFTFTVNEKNGVLVQVLVCKFCGQNVGARSDRIKEHLASKRHRKNKQESLVEIPESGMNLSKACSNGNVDEFAPAVPFHNTMTLPETASAAVPLAVDYEPNKVEIQTVMMGDKKFLLPDLLPLEQSKMSKYSKITSPITLVGSIPSAGSSKIGVSRDLNVRSACPVSQAVNKNKENANSRPEQPLEPQLNVVCVKWIKFDSNIVTMFKKFRSREDLVDVTLWCEEKTIKCHKLVLSACSTHFEKLLTGNTGIVNPHPIIFLRNMKYWEITALVDFMYTGEVNIDEKKLELLLKAAESIGIKALAVTPDSNDVDAYRNFSSRPDKSHSDQSDLRQSQFHNNSPILSQGETIQSFDALKTNNSNHWNSNLPGHEMVSGKRRKKQTPRSIDIDRASVP